MVVEQHLWISYGAKNGAVDFFAVMAKSHFGFWIIARWFLHEVIIHDSSFILIL